MGVIREGRGTRAFVPSNVICPVAPIASLSVQYIFSIFVHMLHQRCTKRLPHGLHAADDKVGRFSRDGAVRRSHGWLNVFVALLEQLGKSQA